MNFNVNKLVPVNPLDLIVHVLYFSRESGVYRFGLGLGLGLGFGFVSSSNHSWWKTAWEQKTH